MKNSIVLLSVAIFIILIMAIINMYLNDVKLKNQLKKEYYSRVVNAIGEKQENDVHFNGDIYEFVLLDLESLSKGEIQKKLTKDEISSIEFSAHEFCLKNPRPFIDPMPKIIAKMQYRENQLKLLVSASNLKLSECKIYADIIKNEIIIISPGVPVFNGVVFKYIACSLGINGKMRRILAMEINRSDTVAKSSVIYENREMVDFSTNVNEYNKIRVLNSDSSFITNLIELKEDAKTNDPIVNKNLYFYNSDDFFIGEGKFNLEIMNAIEMKCITEALIRKINISFNNTVNQ